MKIIEQYKNKKGQTVGAIMEDGFFKKTVKGSKHLMRIFDAWGIDKSILDDLASRGVVGIKIKDLEDGVVYATTVDMYDAEGIEKNFDTLQVFLPREFFQQTGGVKPIKVEEVVEVEPERTSNQASLF